MNVLLVKPYWPYPYSRGEQTYNRIWPPLVLANCAAVLEKAGHQVTIFDAHAQRVKPNRVRNYVSGYDKVFITSSSLDRWQCPNIDLNLFLETVRCIRQTTEEVYIMGYHGTVEPGRILDLTKAKAVIRGEPEYTILDICQNDDLLKIKGLSFEHQGKLTNTPEREPLNMKSLPLSAFHLLDFRKYFYEILGNNFSLFELSRGCKFSCRFCNKVMYGDGLRSKSKDQVLSEISIAVEKYNVKTGYFIDLDFLSNRDIVEQLCEYLIKRKYGFKWTCQTRPDLLDIEILKQMKKAGCQIIHMGIETGLQESLNYLNKRITVDKIKKAVNLCKKADIRVFAFFLFGLPDETVEGRKRILNFAKILNTDFVSFHKIHSYQGSDIYQDNLTINRNADQFICKAFAKYYLRYSYLRKMDIATILRCLRLFSGRIRSL